MNYQQLLIAYRNLWRSRELPIRSNEEETLKFAIVTDIKDDMTHPRLRKTPLQKFQLASKRIIESSLKPDEKVQLIQMHLTQLENIEEQ
ncbi:hypothetical protein ACFFIX_26620 [Metabacillus herbersteinensis]|uniref:Uncharacterized protein n=1 Tax=Metabacillus herbersteinensis TaxID=283816 RepID=A0ABV6GP57_9BACI